MLHLSATCQVEFFDFIVLDVLHKNETKNSDMVDIMHEMTSYPTSYKLTALSGGDHLTCEREQGAKRHVMCSNTAGA